MKAKFSIECEMDPSWVPYFLGMLRTMEQLGKLGDSKWVKLYSDGDGNFRPKFNWLIKIEPAKPVWENDTAVFDAG